tara:strand:- start:2134 stop:2820 length:687 start_codon:yes stop_codon:yes gene_type:complete
MNILIDNRENDLIKLLNKNNYNFSTSNLDVGDIQYKVDNEIVYIIERKTVNDLGASIKDGRYKEQKIRLLSNHKDNIFYIIEGNINFCETISTKAILGSIINMIFRDNIKIIYSKDLKQTEDIIIQIKEKFDSKKFDNNKNNLKTDYISCIKVNKKENLDKKTCNIIQLATIPGVSKKTSTIILEKYIDLNQLIINFKEKDELLLKDLQIGKKKLGKVLSKRIYDYLI